MLPWAQYDLSVAQSITQAVWLFVPTAQFSFGQEQYICSELSNLRFLLRPVFLRGRRASQMRRSIFNINQNFGFRVSFPKKSIMASLQPQMKAPEFKGTAVVNGEFKEVGLQWICASQVELYLYQICSRSSCPTMLGSMWCSSSTPSTSPLSAPLRSLPSMTGWTD